MAGRVGYEDMTLQVLVGSIRTNPIEERLPPLPNQAAAPNTISMLECVHPGALLRRPIRITLILTPAVRTDPENPFPHS